MRTRLKCAHELWWPQTQIQLSPCCCEDGTKLQCFSFQFIWWMKIEMYTEMFLNCQRKVYINVTDKKDFLACHCMLAKKWKRESLPLVHWTVSFSVVTFDTDRFDKYSDTHVDDLKHRYHTYTNGHSHNILCSCICYNNWPNFYFFYFFYFPWFSILDHWVWLQGN